MKSLTKTYATRKSAMAGQVKVINWVIVLLTLTTIAMGTTAVKCPPKCLCDRPREVICMHQRLQKVPQNVPTDTVRLYIGDNLITEIGATDFAGLVNLETLSLKGNQIIKINDGAFSTNSKLKTIFLTNNLLNNVSAEAFKGLTSLENLYLTNCKLVAIPDLQYAVSLRKLNLDTNKISDATFPAGYKNLLYLKQIIMTDNSPITEIKMNSFESVQHAPITKMSLGRCTIAKMANNSFSKLTSLESLSIAYNKISNADIDGFIQGLAGSAIQALDLSGVFQDLNALPTGTFSVLAGVPLFQLKLAHSDIRVLQSKCFFGLSRLRRLDLSYVKITTAEKDAFLGLDSLEELKLYRNRLIAIPQNMQLPSLLRLDISHNQIEDIPNQMFVYMRKLKELYIHDCSVVRIESLALVGVDNLEILDLSYNKIGGSNIGKEVMKNLQHLGKLYLQGNTLTTINKDTKLFSGLSNLTILDMSNSQCRSLSDGLFHPLKKLEVLKLNQNSLGQLLAADNAGRTLAGLQNLKELHLENNQLSSLPAALFKDLHKLETLNIQRNQLYHWDSEIFQPLKKMKMADLSMNQISIINETSLLYVSPSTRLNLSFNPFNCDCDLVWFRNWLSTSNEIFLNLSTYTCKSPAKLEGRPVLAFNPDSIWTTCHWLDILGICIGIVFLLTAMSAGITYRYRWKIWVRYYFVRHYFRNRRQPYGYGPHVAQTDGDAGCLIDDTDARPPEYDAILSSEEDDTEFVENFLLPNISIRHTDEECQHARHNICYPKGDIDWGQHTSQFADFAHPSVSKKMIVVMSERYMNTSSKADFELGVARHRRAKENKNVIIIIFIGTPELQFRATADIRELLGSDQCVVWDRDWQDDPDSHQDAIQVFFENVRDLLDKQVLLTFPVGLRV